MGARSRTCRITEKMKCLAAWHREAPVISYVVVDAVVGHCRCCDGSISDSQLDI